VLFRSSRLDGATLIPLGELATRLGELDPGQPVVLFCRDGHRSVRALQILLGAGFEQVMNLRGGLNRWAEQVDPRLYQY
jgi:rhodanese-related sulfurtransferase